MPRKKQEAKNIYITFLESGSQGGRRGKTLTEAGWELVSTLSQFQATDEEIVAALCGNTDEDWDNITVATLTNDYNKERFLEKKSKGRNRGKTSLRSWQFAAAKQGNTSLLIHLGKNYLGQTDRPETDTPDTTINISISAATNSDIDEE